jgi:hypothetical protein
MVDVEQRDEDIPIGIDGTQWSDGRVERYITVDPMHPDDPITPQQARELAAVLMRQPTRLSGGRRDNHDRTPRRRPDRLHLVVHLRRRPRRVFAEDQNCMGESLITPLSHNDDGGQVSVMAWRYNGKRPDVVLNVGVDDTDVDVHLTPVQARLLVESLLAVAETVEATG